MIATERNRRAWASKPRLPSVLQTPLYYGRRLSLVTAIAGPVRARLARAVTSPIVALPHHLPPIHASCGRPYCLHFDGASRQYFSLQNASSLFLHAKEGCSTEACSYRSCVIDDRSVKGLSAAYRFPCMNLFPSGGSGGRRGACCYFFHALRFVGAGGRPSVMGFFHLAGSRARRSSTDRSHHMAAFRHPSSHSSLHMHGTLNRPTLSRPSPSHPSLVFKPAPPSSPSTFHLPSAHPLLPLVPSNPRA